MSCVVDIIVANHAHRWHRARRRKALSLPTSAQDHVLVIVLFSLQIYITDQAEALDLLYGPKAMLCVKIHVPARASRSGLCQPHIDTSPQHQKW